MRFIGFQTNLTAVFLFVAATALFGYLNIKPGYAHDPIFIEDTHIFPADGPHLPDGNISFALYGTLKTASDSRGFSCNLKAGDELVLSLLVPNLNPEKNLSFEQLPTLTIDRPDNSSIDLYPDKREIFNEPFTGTSYLTLLSINERAKTGIYRITINGNHPGRFTVSIGSTERFGTPVRNVINRSSNLSRLSDWYSDPLQQTNRKLTHERSRGNTYKYNRFVIFGIVGLAFISF